MKIEREFVYIDCSLPKRSNYTSSGWLIVDKPHFDPNPPHRLHVLMHDVLEHHTDDGDGVEFEFMAFGATYFIRVLGHWKRFTFGFNSPDAVMLSDIFYFLRQVDFKVPPAPEGAVLAPELEAHFNYVRNWSNEAKEKSEVLDTVFLWISHGFQRAKARWSGNTSKQVCRMFEAMFDYMDGCDAKNEFKQPDADYRHDGDRMTVTFDTKTLEWNFAFKSNRRRNNSSLTQLIKKHKAA